MPIAAVTSGLRVHEGKPVADAAGDTGYVRAEDRYDVSILQPLDPIVSLTRITRVKLQTGLFGERGDGLVFGFTDQYDRLAERR